MQKRTFPRTFLILQGTESKRCWKHSSDPLVHIDVAASHTSCRFVSRTRTMSCLLPGPKGALLNFYVWRSFKSSEFIVTFKNPVWDDLNFVTWCVILLEVAIIRCVHCGHKGVYVVSSSTWVGCLNSAPLILRSPKCLKIISHPLIEFEHQPEPLAQGRVDPCFHAVHGKVQMTQLRHQGSPEGFCCPVLMSPC